MILTDKEIDDISGECKTSGMTHDGGAAIMSAQDLIDYGRAVESAVLERLVPKVVFATLQIAFNHWLQHGTPIKAEDSALVALDVLRALPQPPTSEGM